MKKFIVTYHTPMEAAMQMANATPVEQAKGIEGWLNWAKKCGNKLIDMGSPLTNGQQLVPGGASKISDKNLTGYSVLQAENMEEAKNLLEEHPHLSWNTDCSIELHEALPLPGL